MLSDIFQYLKQYLKTFIFSKSFFIFLAGFFLSIAALSHYIFGNDNLLEQLGEYFVFLQTGKEIDFTPEDSNQSIIDAITTTIEAVRNANE